MALTNKQISLIGQTAAEYIKENHSYDLFFGLGSFLYNLTKNQQAAIIKSKISSKKAENVTAINNLDNVKSASNTVLTNQNSDIDNVVAELP